MLKRTRMYRRSRLRLARLTQKRSTNVLSLGVVLALGLVFMAGEGQRQSASPLLPQVQPSASAAASVPQSAPRALQSRFWSQSLGRQMPFRIYLPPGYESDTSVEYPVLYMLHGLGGSNADWQNQGLFDAATAMISRGEIPPMIIVTPEGESGYWVDHYKNGPRYGSYISKDLVSFIDANYRTKAYGSARAIGGLSMGGHGALQLALNNLGEFGIVGAHSVALRTKEQAFDFFGDISYYQAHDPMSITATQTGRVRPLRLWIDIGLSDPWLARAEQYHQLLGRLGVNHVWKTWAGDHNGAYWSAHVPDYLRYYGSSFEALEIESKLTAWSELR